MLDFFLMVIPKNKTAVNTPPSLVQGWGLLIFHAELQQREVNCQHGFSVTVPQGEVQDWCASPLQSLQLQESNVLWALWHAALGSCTARTEVWWWVPGVCGTVWAWEQAAVFRELQSKEPNLISCISVWSLDEMVSGMVKMWSRGPSLKEDL